MRSINHKSDRPATFSKPKSHSRPRYLFAPVTEKYVPVAEDFEVRAVYLTGVWRAATKESASSSHSREVGGNAVVFDIKDSDGSVAIPFEHPLLGEHKVYIHDVPKLVRFLRPQNMHAIARIAIFRDERLVTHTPNSQSSPARQGSWRENGKLVWTDPSNPKVQEYNIALARHVAQLGVDEVQFDYVRFPAEGDQKDAAFVFQNGLPVPEAAPAVARIPPAWSPLPGAILKREGAEPRLRRCRKAPARSQPSPRPVARNVPM